METTAKVHEKYNEDEGRFEFTATCPFDRKKTIMVADEIIQKCGHYVRHAHGCGGTIFVFRQSSEAAA